MSYRDTGVDIEAGAEAVRQMTAAVQSTYGPEVLAGVGAFGGLFAADALKALDAPVLVASTDGVGTKTKLATRLGRFDTLGEDLVNHCINDVLVQGARPLFFLDYVAASRLDPARVAAVVGGCARACRAAGVALLGGETAEMPGVYVDGELDVAGTLVGVVERGRLIDGQAIRPGDAVLGLASSGLHTNGYSLARRLVDDLDLAAHHGLDRPLGEALLAPHRAYLTEIMVLLAAGVGIHGLCHITGGGVIDNPPRVLPAETALVLDTAAWTVPPLFRLLQRLGDVEERELRRVFNVGLGMLVVVPADEADAALARVRRTCEAWPVGHIAPRGDGEPVVFR
ncbi:MAG: phosphoribosylformylglycinamidine cyclo-ligase [Myxococcales bacterium]|nr:phosphoribosylformylglycinamidine cyclo-ligase [Myxococcales bacterium]